MAENQSPTFFAVALLLLAAAAAPPLALAQIPPIQLLPPGAPNLLNAVQITGALCCTSTGNCPGGPGIAGVKYTLRCRTVSLASDSRSLVVSEGVTGINGGFNITLINIPALLNSLGLTVADFLAGRLPCEVNIALPLDQALCPALSCINGILAGVLSPPGTFMTPGFRVTFFVRLA